jgi:hypothetical protein
MATIQTLQLIASRSTSDNWRHRFRLRLCVVVSIFLVLALGIYGFPYYKLPVSARFFSPFHHGLKPGGSFGKWLGILGFLLFCGLFLYPLRKRWNWLGRFGNTRHWLDFHVLLGVMAPLLITFHSSFKFGGLAGIAYWIMIAVALSGFIGRYFYALIPRSISQAELSLKEMEAILSASAEELTLQPFFPREDIALFSRLPSSGEVRQMSLLKALGTLLRLDFQRFFWIAGLRRRVIGKSSKWLTLGGLMPSSSRALEVVIATLQRQSRMAARILFFYKIQEVFHLWHVIHRPFSYSFAVLVCIHVGTVLLLGYF